MSLVRWRVGDVQVDSQSYQNVKAKAGKRGGRVAYLDRGADGGQAYVPTQSIHKTSIIVWRWRVLDKVMNDLWRAEEKAERIGG